jgi:hypothetical protein
MKLRIALNGISKDCDDSLLKRFSLGVELRRDFRRGNRAYLQLGPESGPTISVARAPRQMPDPTAS